MSIVVLDTYAQVMIGGDENSAVDGGTAITHCKGIHRGSGAMVILIHHSGKDSTKGARGWSGLRAAADVEIEVIRSNEHRAAKVTKLKDGEDGREYGFTLDPVMIGVDEDGEPITSCHLIHNENGAPKKAKEPGGANQKMILDVLREDLTGSMHRQDLIDAVNKKYGKDEKGNRNRSIDNLIAGGFLRANGLQISLELEK